MAKQTQKVTHTVQFKIACIFVALLIFVLAAFAAFEFSDTASEEMGNGVQGAAVCDVDHASSQQVDEILTPDLIQVSEEHASNLAARGIEVSGSETSRTNEGGTKTRYGTNKVLLTCASSTPEANVDEAFGNLGLEVVVKRVVSNTLVEGETLLEVAYSGSADALDVSNEINNSGEFISASPNYINSFCATDQQTSDVQAQDETNRLEYTINDKYKSKLWNNDAVNATSAWDTARTNNNATVVVIDSGVDYTHEDLSANLVSESYAKNTYSDTYGSSAVTDSEGHGTHVAGIAAAVANNSKGVAGVSYNANVLPIKASNDGGGLYTSDVIEGIEYAVNLKKTSSDAKLKNIASINLSLGGYYSGSYWFYAAIESARNAGIVVCAAAGNEASLDTKSDGTRHYPSSFDNTIGVSALTYTTSWDWSSFSNKISGYKFDSSYSNYGTSVDIASPGTEIYSTVPTTVTSFGYAIKNGTSMATPLVAGAAALLYSQNTGASAKEIETVLKSTAKDMGDAGRDNYYGYGMLDVANAVQKHAACISGSHTWGVWQTTSYATCTSKAKQTRTCSICAAEQTQEVGEIASHNYTANVTQPTCTEKGFTTHTCSVCKDTYTDTYIDALGHNYTAVVTAPTCTNQGFTTHTCTNCNDSYITDYTDMTEHTFGTWVTTTNPTCTAKGVQTRTCSGCNKQETQELDMLSHTYEQVVTQPTCTEQGYTTHTCTSCNDTYTTDYTEALGHTFSDWVTTKDPTCTTKGEQIKTCSTCNATETQQLDAHGHKYASTWVAPTCTTSGYTLYSCSICDNTYKANFSSPLGHAFGTWYTTQNATCTEKGLQERKCSDCNATETQELDALGHTYEETVTAPTCTERGFTTYTCNVCNNSYKANYVDEKGHSFGEWQTTLEPTCTSKGKQTRICSECNLHDTQKLDALGHTYKAEVTKPTCTERGFTTYTCSTCNAASYTSDYTNALGHSYKEVVIAPTCTSGGQTKHTCTHCADEYTDSYTNALGHSFGDWVVVTPATTEAEGLKERTCTTCNEKETEAIPKVEIVEPDPVPEPTPMPEPEVDPAPDSESDITKPDSASNKATTLRLAGNSSAETAAAIAKEAFPEGVSSGWVVIARDDDFADAMSATGLAGALDAPILLTSRNELSSVTAQTVKDLGATQAYIIGGTGAIPADLESALANVGCAVKERVFGNEAWDTSVECAKRISKHGGNQTHEAIVAMSTNFQDALSISSFAYKYAVPIFLQTDASNGSCLTDAAKTAVTEATNSTGTIYVPGGTGAVPASSVEEVFTTNNIVRISGEDDYDTSNQIATYMVLNNKLSASCVCIANGAEAPKGTDALAGAVLAGKQGGVMLLANTVQNFGTTSTTTISGTDSKGTQAFFSTNAKSISNAYVLGGTSVIPNALKASIEVILN